MVLQGDPILLILALIESLFAALLQLFKLSTELHIPYQTFAGWFNLVFIYIKNTEKHENKAQQHNFFVQHYKVHRPLREGESYKSRNVQRVNRQSGEKCRYT